MTSRVIPIALEGDATWSRERRIGHYGGALDKHASKTEGDRPYAYRYFCSLQDQRGTAFTTEARTFVHYENVAIGRFFAGLRRAAEKVETNALAVTSDEKLEAHAEALRVQHFPGDTRHDLRLRCAAKDKAATGNDRATVDAAIAELLGPVYVRSWRQEGVNLATPPTQTFWPGANPGPADYSLGGGAWLSERSNLVVEVQIQSGMTTATFLELVNTHLFHLLTWLLPSYMTFNWALDVDTGFALDVSELDFVGLIP